MVLKVIDRLSIGSSSFPPLLQPATFSAVMKSIHYAKTLTGAACLALLPLTASAQDDFDPAKMEEIMKKYGNPGERAQGSPLLGGNLEDGEHLLDDAGGSAHEEFR